MGDSGDCSTWPTYLQLPRLAQEACGQSIQDAVQIDALEAAQVDHVVATRKESGGHDASQAAEDEDPEVRPLAMLSLCALLQRVQLLGGDDPQISGPLVLRVGGGVTRKVGRGDLVVVLGGAEATSKERHELLRGGWHWH